MSEKEWKCEMKLRSPGFIKDRSGNAQFYNEGENTGLISFKTVASFPINHA
jgi:hypothetical protein